MRVKVHPHRNMVKSGVEACVSITPDRPRGRAYYMGTVALRDVSFRIHDSGVKRAQSEQVRNVHAWLVGDIVEEKTERYDMPKVTKHMKKVTYHYNIGRFVDEAGNDVTDKTFKAALFVGPDLYVSKV